MLKLVSPSRFDGDVCRLPTWARSVSRAALTACSSLEHHRSSRAIFSVSNSWGSAVKHGEKENSEKLSVSMCVFVCVCVVDEMLHRWMAVTVATERRQHVLHGPRDEDKKHVNVKKAEKTKKEVTSNVCLGFRR